MTTSDEHHRESAVAYFDLPLDDLRRYRPELAEPADLDAFWTRTLAAAAAYPIDVRHTPVDTHLRLAVDDVTFAGWGGHPIRGWFVRPETNDDLPVVVQYVGYGGGRGLAHEHTFWPSAGYALLVMDTRGQGGTWGGGGATPDPVGGGPAYPGHLTRGIEDPAHHYYTRLFTDAARAIVAATHLPGVDPRRVIATGVSQGGGLALAAAALVPDVVTHVMPDVPFLAHLRRAIEITDAFPYAEVVGLLATRRDLADVALRTLDHVDVMHLGRRARADALFSVALRDPVCPPSTVYAAFHHYGTLADAPPATRIVEYAYNQHEGGQAYQQAEQLAWLAERL